MQSQRRQPLEDLHTHSTWSDGTGTLRQNIDAASARGVTRLGCVEHVRRETSWLPMYVADVREARRETDIALLCGVEAKLLDEDGRLDVPPDLTGVDAVWIADHQFPWRDGLVDPRVMRSWVRSGRVERSQVIEALVNATQAAMRRHPGAVIAHPFSVLPKGGLREADIPTDVLNRLARTARSTGATIEISERWRCPSVRSVEVFASMDVRLALSTDSHRPEHIGVYRYATDVLLQATGRGDERRRAA